jgi:hypothetical protein
LPQRPFTAGIVALLTAAVALWRLPRAARREMLVVALLSGVAVFLWRISANRAQLNDDGSLRPCNDPYPRDGPLDCRDHDVG